MAGVLLAVVDVNLADFTQSTERAGTRKVVDQVVAGSSVLTWVGQAVVDVQFAVLSLESFGTMALVSADEVFANSTVSTRG